MFAWPQLNTRAVGRTRNIQCSLNVRIIDNNRLYKVFSDFVNGILSSLHFDLFNWKPSALDFVTNSSTCDCIELVPFFSTHSARVVSSTYLQIFVFATQKPNSIHLKFFVLFEYVPF